MAKKLIGNEQACAQICRNMAATYDRLSARARRAKRVSDANLYSDWAGGARACAIEIEATFGIGIIGERCDCMPPLGQHYSEAHDKSKREPSADIPPGTPKA